MSFKSRILWICPAILLASWLAVRSLAASPPQDALDDPPPPSSLASVSRLPEVRDAALASLIAGFAEEAHARRR